MTENNAMVRPQSAVIPYRNRVKRLEVLLIRSSDGLRWGIPKGNLEKGMLPADSAAREAYEEAGILGVVNPNSIGTFTYEKWGRTCRVETFLMEVSTQLEVWPEKRLRTREWVALDEAIRRVRDEQLKRLLLNVQPSLQP